ncbi:hypothetical protein Nepgr_003371 [Nepenthes gracilis]|uniref:RING-type domain-containing protein n=1 Tax=Nepenthes gracilis TaxID=150966 RepID=A0AAD3RZI3_NEPGR|nr:hypothetical protein Nepgr_003371 [Nepenthes gracilis]
MRQKQQPSKSSYKESIKALEADIEHANNLAAALSRDYCVDCIQMRLSYGPLAPLFLYLVEWLDCSCTDSILNFMGLFYILVYKVYADGMPSNPSQEKKATPKEFYDVIYPSLRQLQGDVVELEESEKRSKSSQVWSRRRTEDMRKFPEKDFEKDDECGICMEPCMKMVLPRCGHSMCIRCFRDWNARSRSCPFCRGSLKKVSSKDLWVLITNRDVIDTTTIARENISRFYLYIDSLTPVVADTNVFAYDYMI